MKHPNAFYKCDHCNSHHRAIELYGRGGKWLCKGCADKVGIGNSGELCSRLDLSLENERCATAADAVVHALVRQGIEGDELLEVAPAIDDALREAQGIPVNKHGLPINPRQRMQGMGEVR